jgi:DNA-binding response OmpR family regulator
MAAKILLIDDEPDLLELIADFLEMEDFEVLKAENGTDALELYSQHSDIAAIISDQNLGDMTGNDILEKLKAGGDYPPFFFSTGSLDYTQES